MKYKLWVAFLTATLCSPIYANNIVTHDWVAVSPVISTQNPKSVGTTSQFNSPVLSVQNPKTTGTVGQFNSPVLSVQNPKTTGTVGQFNSPVLSVKPGFKVPDTGYYFAMMPDVVGTPEISFTINGKEIQENTSITESQNICIKLDYTNFSYKDNIKEIRFYAENKATGEIFNLPNLIYRNEVWEDLVLVSLPANQEYVLKVETMTNDDKFHIAESNTVKVIVTELNILTPVTQLTSAIDKIDVTFSIKKESAFKKLSLILVNNKTSQEIVIDSDIDLTNLTTSTSADGETLYTYPVTLPTELKQFYFKLVGEK